MGSIMVEHHGSVENELCSENGLYRMSYRYNRSKSAQNHRTKGIRCGSNVGGTLCPQFFLVAEAP